MTLLIKFRENFLFNEDFHCWSWAKVIPILNKMGHLVTKYQSISDTQAKKTIKKEGLFLTEKDKVMQIWDTPDRAFQQKYKHRIKVLDL